MPPKLKGKTQKKKKTKKQKDGSGSIEEQYRRAALEVDVLQDHLALRRHVTRRAQELKEELQEKLQVLQSDIEGERDEKQAIYSEMTRKQRNLELESSERIQSLEEEVAELKLKLGEFGDFSYINKSELLYYLVVLVFAKYGFLLTNLLYSGSWL
ncbi:Hypothetical predicted protein [Pelobates cultripes]|uniref:Dynein regulatory complex protein 12 n=1 Tax=Pelobates cultripes TaxID=61616 RepID=A0AAD1WRT8_PELCU|nr:Hypothetical predicted protein [Pelobates cultripes]